MEAQVRPESNPWYLKYNPAQNQWSVASYFASHQEHQFGRDSFGQEEYHEVVVSMQHVDQL